MIEKTEKTDRFLRMLGLARRAGKVVFGTPLSLQALHKGRVRLLIVCSEASEQTKKKMHTQAEFYHVPLIVLEKKISPIQSPLHFMFSTIRGPVYISIYKKSKIDRLLVVSA